MGKFLVKHHLPKLNEEAESLNRPITTEEIEAVIEKLLTHKSLDQMLSQKNSTEHLRGSQPPSSTDYFKKFKRMEDSQTLFMKPTSS